MARRRTHRRTRRTKYRLLDRVLLAGIVGGAVYLIMHSVLTVGPRSAMVLGLMMFAFTLGAVSRLPHLRSPIVWRHRR